MSTQWHYADRDQQQRGPVDAAWLQAAFGRGEVNANTLLWREGLSRWQPLSAVAADLGIAVSASAPPPLPRPVTIVRPGGGSSWVLVALVIGGGLFAMLGILAAIAIPAYQDYVQRAKLSEALAQASSVKFGVSEFIAANERCPGNEDEGFAPPASYARGVLRSIHVGTLDDRPGHCTIELRLFGLQHATEDSLWLIHPDTIEGSWSYRTTLPPRMLPRAVRDSLDAP